MATSRFDEAGLAGSPGAADVAAYHCVADARRDIDDIDRTLAELLRRRRSASEWVQQARLRDGGRRLDSGREFEIRTTYRAVLGDAGEDVAAAVLRLCRG